jgi:hypothetical protein
LVIQGKVSNGNGKNRKKGPEKGNCQGRTLHRLRRVQIHMEMCGEWADKSMGMVKRGME